MRTLTGGGTAEAGRSARRSRKRYAPPSLSAAKPGVRRETAKPIAS